MTFNDTLMFLLIGGGAGILSGLFGIGGGILIVPALVLLSGMGLKEAYGTSLASLLLPVGILGCIVYYKEKLLNIKAALAVAFGIICTIALGAYTANILGTFELKICYSIFLIYIGIKFLNPVTSLQNLFRRESQTKPDPGVEVQIPQPAESAADRQLYLKCYIIGLLAGIVSGFFGIGGGAIIVPLLTMWLKFDTKKAIATSLGVLLPPIGLPGVLVYYSAGNLNISIALCVAFGLLLGTIFGAKLTVRLPSRSVKAAYGMLLIITGIKFSLNIF